MRSGWFVQPCGKNDLLHLEHADGGMDSCGDGLSDGIIDGLFDARNLLNVALGMSRCLCAADPWYWRTRF
ncbi:MAG: hypothetical protein AAGK37_11825 [Pseudomonadota bacterium]